MMQRNVLDENISTERLDLSKPMFYKLEEQNNLLHNVKIYKNNSKFINYLFNILNIIYFQIIKSNSK